MSDFITNLSQRVLGTASLVRPSFPSLFAPQRGARKQGEFMGSEIGLSSGKELHSSAEAARYGTYRSAGKAWGGDRDELYSSFPADQSDHVGNPAGTSAQGPVPESLPAKRSLLPPILPAAEEELSGSRQRITEDLFSVSGPDSRVDAAIASGTERGTAAQRREEGSEESAGKKKSRGVGEEESQRKEPARTLDKEPDRLIARTIERTISKSDERRSENIGPRRLVAADRISEEPGEKGWIGPEGGEEKVRRSEAFGEDISSFAEDSAPPFAEPDRALSPDALRGVVPNEGRKENRSDGKASSVRGKLLVPNHAPRNEREEGGDGMLLPPAPVDQSEKDSPSSRTINVTIGRIEVRGTPERKAPPPARQPTKKGAEPTPVMSLDDYLKRYNGRGG